MKVTLTINHKQKTLDVSPNEYLLQTLRKLGVFSVKNGCNQSSCGVCTVLIDDHPNLSCSLLTARLEGKTILTSEGLYDEIEYFYTFFGDEGGDQCGFCNNGLALTSIALKRHLKNPTDDTIKRYLVGNLCRCTGYQMQFNAIKRYVGDKR